MRTYPVGVQEMLGSPAVPSRVLRGDWYNFCYLTQAQELMAQMQTQLAAQLGGNQLSLVDGSEEGLLFTYSSDAPNATPRIWYIQGQDINGNQILETAGYIIDREVVGAQFIDQGFGPNGVWPAGKTLKMNFSVGYGYVEFFWSV